MGKFSWPIHFCARLRNIIYAGNFLWFDILVGSANLLSRSAQSPIEAIWEENNKMEWKPLIHFYTKWARELFLGYSPLTSAIWSCQTCEIFRARGSDIFLAPFLILLILKFELVEDNWGKLVGFSSTKDVDLIRSNLKSVSSLSDNWFFFWGVWGKKHLKSIMLYALTKPERELLSKRYDIRTTQHMHDQTTSIQSSHWVYMVCYSLAKHVSQELWSFSDAIFIFLCRRIRRQVGENWWGSCQLRMLSWFSLNWSQFQFLVIVDYSLGKRHIESMLYA